MSNNVVEDILGQIPADQLAQQLGVDEETAMQAARAVIPSLIGGMQHNAQDLTGEQGLAGALLDHSGSSLFDNDQVDLGQIDVSDGEKIIGHVFGDQSGQLAQAIGTRTQGGSSLIDKLLPLLAPIVLAYIAKQITQGSQQAGHGNILSDILGGVLGGGSQQDQYQAPQQRAPQQQSGSILSDILGGILSGGLGGAMGGGAQEPAYPQQQRQPYPQQQSYPQQNNPFNVPGGNDPGELRIDDSAPTGVDGEPLPSGQQQRQDGGILGDILGGIFGRR